jgi:hypothetical protein
MDGITERLVAGVARIDERTLAMQHDIHSIKTTMEESDNDKDRRLRSLEESEAARVKRTLTVGAGAGSASALTAWGAVEFLWRHVRF